MAHQSIGTDVLLEILSRSPLETVGRCRLLSKECNSLTYESQFMRLHCERTGIISGYLIQCMRCNKYFSEFVSMENPNSGSTLSLNFLPGPVKILASTNQGFLLCENMKPKSHRIPEYYVCKPSTKEWQQIPNPKTRYTTQGIAMMVLRSNPLCYKIIRFSDPSSFRNLNRKHENEYSLRCEIFDSNTWAWKQLEEIYLPYGKRLVDDKPAISVCGVFHWLTWENNIFAFNVDDETWGMLSLPDGIDDGNYYLNLANYEGKLALVCEQKRIQQEEDCCFFELWVMEDYSLWVKRHKVSPKPLLEPYVTPIPKGIYNADVALLISYNKVYSYKFKNGSFDVVKLKNIIDVHRVFQFQSDLEPSNMRVIRGINKHPRRERGSLSIKRFSEFIHQLGLPCRGALYPIVIFIFLLFAFTFFWLCFW